METPQMPSKETKAQKAARLEVKRLEGVVGRREDKVADAGLKLSAAKDRVKALKKPKKATTTKKASKGRGTRKNTKKGEK